MTATHPSYGPSGARGVVITSRAAITLDPNRFHGTAFERLTIAAETLAAELDDRQWLDMERTALAIEQLDALMSSVEREAQGLVSAQLMGRLCVLAPSAMLEAVQRTKETTA